VRNTKRDLVEAIHVLAELEAALSDAQQEVSRLRECRDQWKRQAESLAERARQ